MIYQFKDIIIVNFLGILLSKYSSGIDQGLIGELEIDFEVKIKDFTLLKDEDFIYRELIKYQGVFTYEQ